MAASIRCRPLYKFGQNTWRNIYHRHGSSTTGAIFIMVPQVPPDTQESNPIMQYKADPKFSEMTTNNVLTGCSKTALNFDVDIRTLIESLEEEIRDGSEPDGNTVFDKMEDIIAPVDCATNLMTAINMSDLQRFPMTLNNRVQAQMSRSLVMRFTGLETVMGNIDMSNLTEDKKRLLKWYERSMEVEGVNMEMRDRHDLFAYRSAILMKEREFSTKVQLRKAAWQHILYESERDVVMLLPPSVRRSISYDKNNYDQGPWRLCMLESVYKHFMEVCPRRDLREIFWMGKHLMNNEDDADTRHLTSETIEAIMDNRDSLALQQGYNSYADYRVQDTMAGSVENIFIFLNSCREHFLPMARRELDDLQNFATNKTMYLDLELWDIAFYRRLHAQQLYRVNKYDKLPYFNIDNVVTTVIELAEQLFQLKFTQQYADVTDTIHPDVTAYTCHDADTGELMGHLHIDPYKRSPFKVVYNGAVLARGYSERLGITPLSIVMLNLHRPQPGAPCLISYKEVLEVFHQFGSALQKLLARGDNIEMSGFKCMDTDMLQMAGFLMQQFAHLPNVIEDMSAHHLSGEKLSTMAIENLIKCQNHMIAYDMCCILYESAYDIEIHTGSSVKKPFRELHDEMYKLFMPTIINIYDSRWHSEDLLFGNPNNACCYYTSIWSRMIAANIWEEFELAGFENKDKMAKVGKKFRETFLVRANHDSKELFKEFKGMEPSYECLFKLYPMPTDNMLN